MYTKWQSFNFKKTVKCVTNFLQHEHPHPGRQYYGTHRVAYLPNNEEGKKVYALLRRSFEARMTFTVGRSATTGLEDQVIWNDVHHKTRIHGGPTA